MTKSIEEIKNSGKEAIILLADEIIANKYPEIELIHNDFEIRVWTNSKKVVVNYTRRIRYVPLHKEEGDFTYDLSVNVIENSVSPLDFWPEDEFYVLRGKDKENFEFVVKHFGLPVDGFESTIYEKEDSYTVNLDNEAGFGKYFIDKITGEEKEPPMRGSYAPMPQFPVSPEDVDPDPMVEIKE